MQNTLHVKEKRCGLLIPQKLSLPAGNRLASISCKKGNKEMGKNKAK